MEKERPKPVQPSLFQLVITDGVTVDKKDNDRLFLETVDEVLDDLLGRKVRTAIYDYLERNYYIAREDVPKRLGDFLMILERNFGPSAKTIERTIAKRLIPKLNQSPKESASTPQDGSRHP